MITQVDFQIGNNEERKLNKKSSCRSGKRAFDTVELANEALINNHIVNDYKKDEGPLNVYQCEDCGLWHFTSRGPKSDLLNDDEVVERIKRERLATYWERHLR